MGMNTEDYVTYEQAVKLKELGFCGEAMGKYIDCPKDPTLFHGMIYQSWNLEKDEILAPTLAHTAKWLREVKGLFIDVWLYVDGYSWSIEKCGEHDDKGTFIIKHDEVSGDKDSGYFTTYEKALSAGIDAALKLIL